MSFRIFRIDSGVTATISNLTIANGRDSVIAQEFGGGIAVVEGEVSLINTLVAKNVNFDIGADTPDLSGNLISRDFNLIGNVGATFFEANENDLVGSPASPIDPRFVGLNGGDYRLQSTSPARDAGAPDTTGLNLPTTDLGMQPRIFIGRIDIGA